MMHWTTGTENLPFVEGFWSTVRSHPFVFKLVCMALIVLGWSPVSLDKVPKLGRRLCPLPHGVGGTSTPVNSLPVTSCK